MTDLAPGPSPSPSQAQCSVCLQTFSGVTLFDRPRHDGQCRDPRTMRKPSLRQDARGVWRSADPHPLSTRIGEPYAVESPSRVGRDTPGDSEAADWGGEPDGRGGWVSAP